jgi:transcriptional regulator with XRE-family HTH domain
VNPTLQDRFRELRRIRGVSGVQIAEKMGVSKGYVSLIESGKRTVVDQAKLLKLASKLAVNSEWLLTGYGDPNKPTDPATLSILAGLTPPPEVVRETPEPYGARTENDSISVAIGRIEAKMEDLTAEFRALREALKRVIK